MLLSRGDCRGASGAGWCPGGIAGALQRMASSAVRSIGADSAASCWVAVVKLDETLQGSPCPAWLQCFSVFVITSPQFTQKVVQLPVYLLPQAPSLQLLLRQQSLVGGTTSTAHGETPSPLRVGTCFPQGECVS